MSFSSASNPDVTVGNAKIKKEGNLNTYGGKQKDLKADRRRKEEGNNGRYTSYRSLISLQPICKRHVIRFYWSETDLGGRKIGSAVQIHLHFLDLCEWRSYIEH